MPISFWLGYTGGLPRSGGSSPASRSGGIDGTLDKALWQWSKERSVAARL